MKTSFIVWMFVIGVLLDGAAYKYRLTAIPMSSFEVYKEYTDHNQDILPMLFGPFLVWLLAYNLTALFIK